MRTWLFSSKRKAKVKKQQHLSQHLNTVRDNIRLKNRCRSGNGAIIKELMEAGVTGFTLQHTNIPGEKGPAVTRMGDGTAWCCQDLQVVNRAVIPRAPALPDPHTLLNDSKLYSLIQHLKIVAFGLRFVRKKEKIMLPRNSSRLLWISKHLFTGYVSGPWRIWTICRKSAASWRRDFDLARNGEKCARLLHILAGEGHKVNRDKRWQTVV